MADSWKIEEMKEERETSKLKAKHSATTLRAEIVGILLGMLIVSYTMIRMTYILNDYVRGFGE